MGVVTGRGGRCDGLVTRDPSGWLEICPATSVPRLRGKARVNSEGFESAITVPDSEAIDTEGKGLKINCATEVTLRIH